MPGLAILGDYLTYAWSLTSINPILKLVLDELGFDPKITLDRLVSIVVAFPVTLVRTIGGKSPVFSASAAQAGGRRPRRHRGEFFYTLATILLFIWTVASKRPQASGIIDYFDILCPILRNILLLPGFGNDLLWTGFPTDADAPGLIAPAVLAGTAAPIMKIAQKANTALAGHTDDNVVHYDDQAPAQPDAFAQYYARAVPMIAGLAKPSWPPSAARRAARRPAPPGLDLCHGPGRPLQHGRPADHLLAERQHRRPTCRHQGRRRRRRRRRVRGRHRVRGRRCRCLTDAEPS